MGTDMYIHRERRAYLKKGGRTIDLDRLNYSLDGYETDEFGRTNSVQIVTMSAYWRNAYAVHQWFVSNLCGKEVDGRYYLSKEDVTELRGICIGFIEKLDGKTLKVNEETKAFYDRKNEEAALAGEKKPYEYDESIVFDRRTIREMHPILGKYDVDDDGAVAYAMSHLPTECGYSKGVLHGWYLQDAIRTALMLDDVLAEMELAERDGEVCDFYYTAN